MMLTFRREIVYKRGGVRSWVGETGARWSYAKYVLRDQKYVKEHFLSYPPDIINSAFSQWQQSVHLLKNSNDVLLIFLLSGNSSDGMSIQLWIFDIDASFSYTCQP